MTSTQSRSRKRSRAPKTWSAERLAAALLCAGLLSACAPKTFSPPSGTGEPIADAAGLWKRVSEGCAGVRTLTAELALSGRAAGTRLRGRIQAGFAAPSKIRLEGVAPFGQPVFILAADATRATLLLPRDERVVRAAAASEILEALAGVELDANALRAVLAGCVVTGIPTSASQFGNIARFDFDGGSVYARRHGAGWRIVAGESRPFLVEYLEHAGLWPTRVRISRDLPDGSGVNLTLGISQMETNMDLPEEAFTVSVPPGAAPMTVAQLRSAGPLGER